MSLELRKKLLKLSEDTINQIKCIHGYGKQEKMDEAVDMLNEWIKKQGHFVKKDFPRRYVENNILVSKGSIERTKSKMDKKCTLKTIFPRFYRFTNIKYDFENLLSCSTLTVLPRQTSEHYRTILIKIKGNEIFDKTPFMDYYILFLIYVEYLLMYDYNEGFMVIVDYRDVNVMNVITRFNLVDMKQFATLILEGYGFRIKGVHIITESKAAETLVNIVKPLFSQKIANRFQIHSHVESVHQYIPKDILPQELGGQERSCRDIQADWIELLCSKASLEYLKEMSEAKVNESYRLKDVYDEYIGLPGTFRTLTVD